VRLNSKNTLTLKYNYTNSRQQNGTFDVDLWGRSANGLERVYSNAVNGSLSTLIGSSTTNEFRFSFQFAKRFGPLTGRFGIMESTGGIGLDLHLLDDRFELRQDVFGFGEQLAPRWRVTMGYEFVRKLWLLGGVDDILSTDRRDYFVGLQLRFTDTDLKSVLPFAPTP